MFGPATMVVMLLVGVLLVVGALLLGSGRRKRVAIERRCPNCRFDNRKGAEYCAQCGKPLARVKPREHESGADRPATTRDEDRASSSGAAGGTTDKEGGA